VGQPASAVRVSPTGGPGPARGLVQPEPENQLKIKIKSKNRLTSNKSSQVKSSQIRDPSMLLTVATFQPPMFWLNVVA
jgi:hypothetical protein